MFVFFSVGQILCILTNRKPECFLLSDIIFLFWRLVDRILRNTSEEFDGQAIHSNVAPITYTAGRR